MGRKFSKSWGPWVRFQARRGIITFRSSWPPATARALAASKPMIWKQSMFRHSASDGLTFPGMMEEPGWTAGRRISSRPVEGPEAMSRRSLVIRVVSRAKSRGSVQARSDGRAAQGDRPQPVERVLERPRSATQSGAVGAELLPERDRHGVHQVRPSRLDDIGELVSLGCEGAGQAADLGGKRPTEREHRQVKRRRERVVGRLAEVDVVVGIDDLAVV